MEKEIQLHKIKDLRTLLKWRARVLLAVFGKAARVRLRELLYANAVYLRKHVADGSHIAIMASIDGEPVGCGAVCLYDEMPSPDNLSGRCAYIMNVFVKSGHRHEGIATRIVTRLVLEAVQQNADKIYLETTRKGRRLYRDLGFKEMKGFMKL